MLVLLQQGIDGQCQIRESTKHVHTLGQGARLEPAGFRLHRLLAAIMGDRTALFYGWARHQQASLFLDDSPIIQEFDGLLVLAVLPQEGVKPDAAFSYPELGGGESHLRAGRFLAALRGIFPWPAEHLSLATPSGNVEMSGEGLHFTQVRNNRRHTAPSVRVHDDDSTPR